MSLATNKRPVRVPSEVGHGAETIVKLVEGGQEPPLIMIHGGGGAVRAFEPLRTQFKTGLWGIQITSETPLQSIPAQANFYFLKIKEQQPQGPYRLSAFSASSIILVCLAQAFEANGDTIIQLAFIDHFPAVFLCPDIGVHATREHSIDSPMARPTFIANSFRSVCDLTRRDGGGELPRRHELAQDLMNAFSGEAASDFARSFANTMEPYLGAVFDLVTGMSQDREPETLMDCLVTWMRSVKVAATLYIGSTGVIAEIPQHHREKWSDLGARRCLANVKVVYLDAGHYDILSNEQLIRELQAGFTTLAKL
ncbi:Alpha/Beta hydrolase protein [Mycena maculata]|uniref:Alpha/Beta hydrolase protein n=1 Tax=Mycena maculata TaxID=230809 RepID=A0AAD7NER6_9AGAR|nr:Alpha/Beta hydrolase protein [Mycena maculata]